MDRALICNPKFENEMDAASQSFDTHLKLLYRKKYCVGMYGSLLNTMQLPRSSGVQDSDSICGLHKRQPEKLLWQMR